MKKELLSLFKINTNSSSKKFNNKINNNEIQNSNIENLKSHLIYFKNAVNLSLFPTAYTSLNKRNISLKVNLQNNMQWSELENLYFIEKDNYFESNNTEYFKILYEEIKSTSNKLLSSNLNIVFDPKKKAISYNNTGISINILDKFKELSCYQELIYNHLVSQVNLNRLRKNSVFNIPETIHVLKELSLYFIVLEKIEKAYVTENEKEETILNSLIIFEIKKMLINLGTILNKNFNLVLGVYYCNNNINSKSCPFLLNIDISFKYFYERIIIFSPKEIPKISKENIFIGQNNEEKLMANYTTNDEHTIDYNIWESLRREGNFSNIDIFTSGKITNIEKWNLLIDEIIKNFKFSDNYDLFPQYELIEAAKEIDVLYKGYINSINTLTHLIRKNSNQITNNLLYKLLSQSEKTNTETLEQQKKLLSSEKDFYGYLKENIIGNKNTFDYYGLNINQRIFAIKSLYNLTHESNDDINKTNVIALNGPPGTGKTTVLQTVVASEIVRNTLNKKPPIIIFGCSATNQAKENIISGFKYNEIHKENIGIYDRWICLIKEEQGKININNLDYGFSLSYKNSNETFEEFCENFYNSRYLYVEEFIKRYKKSRGSVLSVTQEKALDCLFNILEIKSNDNQWKFLYANKNDLSEIKNELYVLLDNMFHVHENLKIKIKNYLEEKDTNNLIKNFGWLKGLLSDEHEVRKINKSQLKTANIMIKTSQRLDILEEKIKNKITPSNIIMEEFQEILLTILDNITKPAMFNLSMRIQEGIFLEEIQKVNKVEELTKLNEKSLYLRFTMFSRIIPVFVSTMHSLANRLKYFSNGEQQVAIGFIDLLIIDEAGQISPEIGSISLLLSKKALIVGDTDQIEPVYNLEEVIDKCVYKSAFDKDMVDSMEWNSHASSIMEVAQKYTPWRQYPKLSKGLYLLEHNRCPIELISFCDELIYQNQLIYSISSYYVCNKGKPLYENKYSNSLSKVSYKFVTNKQIKPEDLFIPNQTPWKLINNNGGSLNNNKRINKEEIDSIMEWLDNNYEYIVLKNKNIAKVVAIISPFKAQAAAIRKIGKIHNFKNKELNNIKNVIFADIQSEQTIIIGTVHSLQGAEIPIVLFSNVYGEKDQIKTPFIDKQKQIINVGVSRAKQSFYVFANRKFLERFKDSTSATGLLLLYLEKYG